MKNNIKIILFFVAGIFIACFTNIRISYQDVNLTTIVLYILMFLVGISMGVDKKLQKLFTYHNWQIFLFPFLIIVGTLIGVACCYFFIDELSLTEIMAVASGLGYYSLSSVLIAELRTENLASLALFSNIIREIITLLFAPLLVRFFGKYAPIASAGVTAMDTSLPVISRFSGKDVVVIALVSGIVQTLLVPVLVVFFLS